MNNNFFVSCVESRMEQETNWYSRFEIGPFPTGQALTIANSLRRTLLSSNQGIFVTAVEIEGALHEYSRLEGVREAILDILLNLRQVSLLTNEDNIQEDNNLNNESFVGYFDLQGPIEVKAKDLKFPKHIECVNPNQHIATLTRNCTFQGRFLIMKNPTTLFKNQSIGDPLIFTKQSGKQDLGNRLLDKNWLYVNPITNAIQRVNYAVEQFGDVWEQQEIVVLELWTNGTIHPKHAIQNACKNLSNLFASLCSLNTTAFKFPSAFARFKRTKNETHFDLTTSTKAVGEGTLNVAETSSDRLTILFDLDIANLNLSLKTYLCLKNAKIENIGNLLQHKKSELTGFVTLSDEQVFEIESALNIFGLTF
jgi:DNA-directed RNA polymerase subunit alpha